MSTIWMKKMCDMVWLAVMLIIILLLPGVARSGPVISNSIEPNFTASNFEFIDQSGDFLSSINATFKATIHNLKTQDPSLYYFSVKHSPSDTVVWSANPARPVSSSAQLSLTPKGLSLAGVWSTPPLPSPVSAMRLLDSGNLVLLGPTGLVLWQTFAHPSDTLLPAQLLPLSESLAPAAGDYRLTVTPDDAVLLWRGTPYWKLSMEADAYRDTNLPVSFMAVNHSGLYLLAADKSTVVVKASFNKPGAATGVTVLKLGKDGRLSVTTPNTQEEDSEEQFSAPTERCKVPLWCGTLQVCDSGSSTSCLCPAGFLPKPDSSCFPANKSLSLPTCNESRRVSYVSLGDDVDYFANDFTGPARESLSLSACQDLCSNNCSCLALFHRTPSGSCYLLTHQLASLIRTSSNGSAGYLKAVVAPARTHNNGFPVAVLVLLPTTALFLVVGVALLLTLWLRRKRPKLRRWNSSSSADMDDLISIPGLPVRFDYQELAHATDNFATQIGSGGFGTVYRGTLLDNTVVAVKKITGLGVRGKTDFCTEMSIIGSIHHVNLVRLKGFCVQGRQRFLVLEFMNKGSLDRVLFADNCPVLEWKERLEIALGTARGLAYLHSGCDHKIIHCDVKPENILLLLHHNCLQVKISDFGLSKLLSAEQSSLFTTMRGTRGYLAPEWLTNSSISDKADVYSYGMVLMEIIRGKKNSSVHTQSRSSDNESSSARGGSSSNTASSEASAVYFPLMALEMHEQRRYLELADPRLEGRVGEDEVGKAVKIALCCVHEDPALRPTMAAVVGMLEGGTPLPDPRVESLNFLRFYGRRFTEASQNNELVMWKSGTTTSYNNSMSYISAHQLSGPR